MSAAAKPEPAGLSAADAARRLAADGPNALPDRSRRGWAAIAREAAREPMFVLLIGAALLYLLLGERRESLFLLSTVLLMLGMTLYQEGRTEHALAALRDLSAPVATVVRDGRRQRIPAAGVVRGDLLVLAEGDRVAADAVLLEGSALAADESLLTGESVAAGKSPGAETAPPAPPGGDGLPWVFAGTLVVQGDGLARVRATGAHSQLGRIGAALAAIRAPQSRLQRDIRTLARRLALLGLSVSLLLVLVIGMRSGSWLEALLAGVALSMSVLPEEFPVVLTIFPALGAWRLARRNVLARRLAAIEVLGSTSVLCVDKTGTLTENRMALQHLWTGAGDQRFVAGAPLAPALRRLLATAAHASRPQSIDPIDRALEAANGALPPMPATPPAASVVLRDYALTATRPALIRVRREGADIIASAKGAPETVIALCETGERADALAAAADLGRQGLRVLAVAEACALTLPLPEDPATLRYRLLGLVALADPLRDDIPAAVADCLRAGVRVMMITGDHPATAAAIARQAGLPDGATLTGADIARLPAEALAARLDGVSVCARVVPDQKLAIVRALQCCGAVVAMTGDGVNDAPALRAADVGVAMGLRGTDVAREAAELTLLDDRFASLVDAVRAGRRIFSNMRKSMGYVTAIHVPIAVLALLPPLLGWPILLFPLHIVFLELVIDPACTLAFENEPDEANLMRCPPRPPDDALLGRAAIVAALARGFWAAALVVACYAAALAFLPETEARATAFCTLLLCNLGLLLAYRRRSPGGPGMANPLFMAINGVALGLLGVALVVPAAADLLRFDTPPPAWMAAAAGFALLMLTGLRLLRRG